jgi:F-type H+-transporting ATPase subunit c
LYLSKRCNTYALVIIINIKKENIMEPEAAKLIGAGLATIALAGAGIGIGTIFGNYLSGALRNPSAAPGQFPNLLLGFALAEATGLFGLVIALILLFVV